MATFFLRIPESFERAADEGQGVRHCNQATFWMGKRRTIDFVVALLQMRTVSRKKLKLEKYFIKGGSRGREVKVLRWKDILLLE